MNLTLQSTLKFVFKENLKKINNGTKRHLALDVKLNVYDQNTIHTDRPPVFLDR
jgi:hypothetical protein